MSEPQLQENHQAITTPDQDQLWTYSWLPNPQTPLRGCIQILHGMAEHAGRYQEVAHHLAQKGFGVFSHDHRGHGQSKSTALVADPHSPERSWNKLVDDSIFLHKHWQSQHQAPWFILGHSMGSFICRDIIGFHKPMIQGAILSGTAGDPRPLAYGGQFVAWCEAKLRGPEQPSPLLDTLSFGPFNLAFRPCQTKSDWLSSDPESVAAYIADPLCGEVFSAAFYRQLFHGMIKIHNPEAFQGVDPKLPLYLFAGAEDPVGKFGRGVEAVAKAYQEAGCLDLELELYPQGRHEMFHERNKAEVYAKLITWLEKHTAA